MAVSREQLICMDRVSLPTQRLLPRVPIGFREGVVAEASFITGCVWFEASGTSANLQVGAR
jgi:hypothetical protein